MAGLILTNIWCWTMMVLASISALAVTPVWLIFGRLRGLDCARSTREGIWVYGRTYLFLISPFIKVDISGWDAAALSTPVVVVVNHQSWLDNYLLGAQKVRNLSILVRSWPFKRLFFFGPVMRLAGYIETENTGVEKILDQCRLTIQSGAIIVCFPEGTRGPHGSLGRFHSGVFKLATELGATVVPLVIHNSGQIIPKGSWIFRPGLIKMEMGPPLLTEQFNGELIPHRAMQKFVRNRFRNSLGLD